MIDLIKFERRDGAFIRFSTKELFSICPVNGEIDNCHLEIGFQPNCNSLEMGSLRTYILGFRDESILIENLAFEICVGLYNILEPKYLFVRLIRTLPENNIHIEVFQEMGVKEALE